MSLPSASHPAVFSGAYVPPAWAAGSAGASEERGCSPPCPGTGVRVCASIGAVLSRSGLETRRRVSSTGRSSSTGGVSYWLRPWTGVVPVC